MNKLKSLADFKKQIDKKILLTVQEASALCGVSEQRIREQIKLGEIKVTLPDGWNEGKISRTNLEDWIDRRSYYQSQIQEVI